MAPTGDELSDIEDLPSGWNGNSEKENDPEPATKLDARSTRSKLSLKGVKIDALSQNLTETKRMRGRSSSNASTNATVSRSSKASETSGQEESRHRRH